MRPNSVKRTFDESAGRVGRVLVEIRLRGRESGGRVVGAEAGVVWSRARPGLSGTRTLGERQC